VHSSVPKVSGPTPDMTCVTSRGFRSNYGPDCTHSPSGLQVELTSEAQLEAHKLRYGAGIEYVTWR